MPEVIKDKYSRDDIVWFYPFPNDTSQSLKSTRYKAEGHPNRRKKVRAKNLMVYRGNAVE